MAAGFSPCAITASASRPNIRSIFLDCSSGCTRPTNIQGQALASPFARRLWSVIMAASGSNPPREVVPPSVLPSPFEDGKNLRGCHILVVEDNKGDVFLIRESIQAASLEAELHVVQDGEKAIRFIEQTD